MTMMKRFFARAAAEVPTQEHWAIITSDSVHIPGDERSRTAPGHGYPAHTTKFISYEVFLDKAVFELELRSRIQKGLETSGGIPVSLRPLGIHVEAVYTGSSKVELQETK
jgi:hypothetical protein